MYINAWAILYPVICVIDDARCTMPDDCGMVNIESLSLN